MNRQVGDAALSDHYAVVAARRGKATVVEPEIPREAVHVWNAYTRLHNARGSSGLGMNPISFMEIAAFGQLTGIDFDPWEIEAIRALDEEFMTSLKTEKPDG